MLVHTNLLSLEQGTQNQTVLQAIVIFALIFMRVSQINEEMRMFNKK